MALTGQAAAEDAGQGQAAAPAADGGRGERRLHWRQLNSCRSEVGLAMVGAGAGMAVGDGVVGDNVGLTVGGALVVGVRLGGVGGYEQPHYRA